MKKLSLQWRLTFMTASLAAAACLLLTLFVGKSAVMRIDEMENYIIEVIPEGQDSIVIGIDDFSYSEHLAEQIRQSKNIFYIQSAIATLAVIFLSSAVTYFLTGRALKPLRSFSSHMEKIQAQNLSEPLKLPDTQDEIARLHHSFNVMLERLNQTFAAQHQFAANAAHELRTPLTVMRTNLDVLRKRENPTPEEYDETIMMLSEQISRLSHLIDVLLEMTELQTVQRSDKVSLSALIEEVLCDLTHVADEKKVTLVQTAGEAIVGGSDLLLYRAVYNLVENAIKYNQCNGTVTVGVRVENKMAVLSVTDTGIGISEENWNKIFEPFARVDKSRSRAMGGVGLGLALVRDIAQQHNGSVAVAGSSEYGTEIILTLPVINN